MNKDICKACSVEEHSECWEIEPDLECECCVKTMIEMLKADIKQD